MNSPAEPAFLRAAYAIEDHAAAVAGLHAALDAAFDACTTPADPSQCPAFARGMRGALAVALAEPAIILAGQREGSSERYRRHVIAADPAGRYTVAALVWQPGQASPIHAHHTWCGFTVLEGTLTETLYSWEATRGGANAVRDHLRAPGTVSFVGSGCRSGSGHGGIHRLSNDSHAKAVSLHVYGVDAERIATHVNDVLPLATPAPCAVREVNGDARAHDVSPRIARA
ncbi:cysteine dioxygenase family protein [Paraburkholderia dinghuensis]|uniref:Cysteine dioxygenase n=1 Tax=Paraburkholderia dinghuensis TaxID=2305225 RepID=A0A3N6MU66_9BURK|nr:cysteine dioxygenase family protein [Paraburkholderia dinghuensis]RQH07544.1 cysteine dioxygenase [Paraburkholderia dinghuensis]